MRQGDGPGELVGLPPARVVGEQAAREHERHPGRQQREDPHGGPAYGPPTGASGARSSRRPTMTAMCPSLGFSSAAFFGRALDETCKVVAEAGYAHLEVMVTKDPASQDPARMALDRPHLRPDDRGDPRAFAAADPEDLGHRPGGEDLPLDRSRRGSGDPLGGDAPTVPMAAWLPALAGRTPAGAGAAHRRDARDREHVPGPDGRTRHALPREPGPRRTRRASNTSCSTPATLPWPVTIPVEVRRRFGPRVRHVHLSDNAGKGWDSHLPPGEGVLDLDRFMRELAASGYAGSISLEVDMRRTWSDPVLLQERLVAMRERCEAGLAGTAP